MTPEQLVAKHQRMADQPNATPLEGLDAVNWSALEHALGSASDVPALLRATLSSDEDDQEFAFILLFETIWHQGSVYEASAYVVPFLFKMLQAADTPHKGSVAHLLAALADGHSAYAANAYVNAETEVIFRRILAEQGVTLEEQIAKELGWVKAAHDAVGQDLHLLYPYLGHGDATIRWSVAKAMALYPEHATQSLPPLRQALSAEREEYVRAELETAIARLEVQEAEQGG